MSNVNPETGIRYGTIYGHEAPILMEEIFDRGTDLSYENWKRETLNRIKDLLDGADVEALAAFIKENTHDDGSEAAELIENQDGETATDADAESVMESINLGDHYECDEPTYSYTDKAGNAFQMSYLGGAPLIWCLKTNVIVKARLCSPCVPNAGDLSTAGEDGYECYGVPADYVESDE